MGRVSLFAILEAVSLPKFYSRSKLLCFLDLLSIFCLAAETFQRHFRLSEIEFKRSCFMKPFQRVDCLSSHYAALTISLLIFRYCPKINDHFYRAAL